MITLAEFVRFRGFERMRADLAPHAYVVGPNSAGKSTVLEAISLAEQCLKTARRRTPTSTADRDGLTWNVYRLPSSIANEEDPVRHDFGREETRVSVHWATGASLHIVWPREDDREEPGYFYLEEKNGSQPRNTQVVRELFAPVTVVPVITPLDRSEELKDPTYVESHSGTRLASRHFRNHAWKMWRTGQWNAFIEFCNEWMPEIQLLDVSLSTAVNRLAVFYSEPGSRVPKELAWAGDGIQIWVQLLWHLFRAQDATTIVLDEPDVYLHPDLQHRLVRLLDGLNAQIILASHSAEVIAEAPPTCVLWVDRRLGTARRAKSQQSLSALSASLGSSYNLALARTMRARLVIASDCEDLRVIRLLAKLVGANTVANEQAVSLVQLREVSKWSDIKHLGVSLREAIPSKVRTVVLLQAGHRSQIANDEIVSQLTTPGITLKALSRVELENYLLDADTISRASGAARETITQGIADAFWRLRESTRAAFISTWVASAKEGNGRQTLIEAEQQFDALWMQRNGPADLVRGTQVIKELNIWLERDGYRSINGHVLAKAVKPQSLASEMFNVLLEIDEIAC